MKIKNTLVITILLIIVPIILENIFEFLVNFNGVGDLLNTWSVGIGVLLCFLLITMMSAASMWLFLSFLDTSSFSYLFLSLFLFFCSFFFFSAFCVYVNSVL